MCLCVVCPIWDDSVAVVYTWWGVAPASACPASARARARTWVSAASSRVRNTSISALCGAARSASCVRRGGRGIAAPCDAQCGRGGQVRSRRVRVHVRHESRHPHARHWLYHRRRRHHHPIHTARERERESMSMCVSVCAIERQRGGAPRSIVELYARCCFGCLCVGGGRTVCPRQGG
jgi:hypothetical protein